VLAVTRRHAPSRNVTPGAGISRGLSDGAPIWVYNARGEFQARAHVTARIPVGTLWLRDGWPGLNGLTESASVLPDAAADRFTFSAGQSTFNTRVEVTGA
jgi:anaerobic selenocysteine-containing dehydrogenase